MVDAQLGKCTPLSRDLGVFWDTLKCKYNKIKCLVMHILISNKFHEERLIIFIYAVSVVCVYDAAS